VFVNFAERVVVCYGNSACNAYKRHLPRVVQYSSPGLVGEGATLSFKRASVDGVSLENVKAISAAINSCPSKRTMVCEIIILRYLMDGMDTEELCKPYAEVRCGIGTSTWSKAIQDRYGGSSLPT